MKEIWIPELISALFLLLFLFRPLIKGLWPLEGLNWLPLLALAITLGLFPAYGFRPECVPLLLYFLVMTMLNIPSGHGDNFRDQRLILILPAALCLILAIGIAFFFAPMDPTEGAESPQIVEIGDERQDRNYTLYIFGLEEDAGATATVGTTAAADTTTAAAARPLLLVVPPEAGGIRAVDGLCASLADRGFTVISYARRVFDSFSPAKLHRMWQSFRGGTVSKKANDFGRALETGRREDLEFLLPHIRRNSAALTPNADPETLIIAGFGAGGAAAVYLAADPAFITQNRQLRGIAALESGFWSVYRPEERSPLSIPDSEGSFVNWFKKARIAVQNWFAGLKPLKMTGLGTLPRPNVPALYVVSDHALEPGAAQGRYAAALDLLQKAGPAPAALAALSGSGPLDYTDYPVEYPVYSALFPGNGKKTGSSGQKFREDSAALITGFAAAVLKTPPEILHSTALHADIHLTIRSWEDPSWNLGDLRYTLSQ
ncbi:hypothetical protein AGMMS49921_13410 [Endomicrobiia bacterium]|nr:hypothetical protein AGMMS49921_13410 [Endomicrobiia bacterium]